MWEELMRMLYHMDAADKKEKKMKKKLLGYYDYTVILTYCGVLFSLLGILRVISQNYWNAVFCLMLAGVCDMFDGTVASTKDRNASEKRFGIQIDSLSDLISFGVMPAVFVYKLSIIILGIFEALGMILFMGWDAI